MNNWKFGFFQFLIGYFSLVGILVYGKRVLKTEYLDETYLDQLYFSGGQDERRALAAEKLPTANDHKVTSLPGLTKDDTVTHFAGHLPADPSHGGYFFYWLFESKKDSDKKPLIIWLNGGPGCSSMDGLWLELGPFRIFDGGRTIRWNKYSWHDVGNLLFIDQPVGTGLSFTSSKDGMARNDNMVNEHFCTFLLNFLTVHDRYVSSKSGRKRSRPIVFTGESHAGHYIPSIVHFILEQNRLHPENVEIVVQGIALGNPWIDPPNQYNPAEFAHGQGIITGGQVNRLKDQELQCRNFLYEGKLNNKVCMNLLDDVIDSSSVGNGAKVVMYDTRQYATSSRSFPPGHEDVESYLNRMDVKRAIHATRSPQRYVECADPPYYALSHQDGKGVTEELISVLDSGIPVLIYLGQFDLICNHMNMEKVLDGLLWSGHNEWLKSQPGVWMQNNRPVGYIRKYKNLQSLLVLNAGHMVPMDQPEVALAMLQTFVAGRDFSSGLSKVGVTVSPSSMCSLNHSPSGDTSVSSEPQPHRRSLVDNPQPGSNLQFCPILIHATPLDKEVFLRIRMHPLSSSSSYSMMRSASNRLMEQAWDSLASSTFYILVEPTDQVIRFNQNRSWITTLQNRGGDAVNNNSTGGTRGGHSLRPLHNHHLDIVVTGLQYGTIYTFSMHHDYDPAHLPSALPAAFSRNIHAKVGCFTTGFEQCCGRGDCVVTNGETPKCHCDAGYSGEHCDHYAVTGFDPVMNAPTAGTGKNLRTPVAHTHVNPHSPRRQLQVENVSASDSMCPTRVLPSAAAIHLPLTSLPHKSSEVAKDKLEPSSKNDVHIGKVSSAAVSQVAECTGQQQACCVTLKFSVLRKKVASDSNVNMHSKEYRTVQRQRLQQGLAETLRQYAGVNRAELQVQVLEIGVDEEGRRGQKVTASVCGDAALTTSAMKKFIAEVDSDKAEIKKAHDVFALQGPVITASVPKSSIKSKPN